MAQVTVKPNESLDSALRRFKKQIQEAGVLKEARRHEHYESPAAPPPCQAARWRKIKAAEEASR